MSVENPNNISRTLPAFAALLALAACSTPASETAGWRTDGNGKYAAATPPTEWSATKNVVWSTPLPGHSNGSPALFGGMLYMTADPETLLCVDASSGKILWQKTNTLEDAATPEEVAKYEAAKKDADPLRKELQKLQADTRDARQQSEKAPGDADLKKKLDDLKAKIGEVNTRLDGLNPILSAFDPARTHKTNGYSSATPVTDGKNVYAVFGNGVACCYDVKGERVWIRHIEPPSNQQGWGHSASPVLSGDKVFVHLTELRALNAATGADAWTVKLQASWGTPAEVKIGDVPALLTPAGELVRISDGHVMARNLARLEFASPIVSEGVAYFVEAGGKAIKLPEKAADSVTPEVLWTAARGAKKAKEAAPANAAADPWTTPPLNERYYASAILHDGLLYDITRYGQYSVIDAKTGAIVFTKMLDHAGKAEFYPSVTFAGGHLYVSSDDGQTLVLEPGREYKEIAKNTLEDFRGSPVFDGKRVYIRGQTKLYCIGE